MTLHLNSLLPSTFAVVGEAFREIRWPQRVSARSFGVLAHCTCSTFWVAFDGLLLPHSSSIVTGQEANPRQTRACTVRLKMLKIGGSGLLLWQTCLYTILCIPGNILWQLSLMQQVLYECLPYVHVYVTLVSKCIDSITGLGWRLVINYLVQLLTSPTKQCLRNQGILK